MRVLVVEDDASTRSLIAEVLRQRGHEVTEAADGEGAWTCWGRDDFGLVVLDWLSPGMDGRTLCGRIRSSPGGDTAFILMSTGRNRPEDFQAALEAGADDCIARPLTLQPLLERLAVAEQRVQRVRRQRHPPLRDDLTGLPTRELLMDRLELAIRSAHRQDTPVALLTVDLDCFKAVNDRFGQHVGDLLLEQVGARLQGTLRASDTVARLGGDEFAVILPTTDETGAVAACSKLLNTIAEPIILEGEILSIHGSVGITLCPEHGEESERLLWQAEAAMHLAQRTQSGYALFDPNPDQQPARRYALRGQLRRAIEHGELTLHYQPKLSLITRNIESVEALVRWEHPRHGLLPPDQFVPLAEHTGLIESLSPRVLDAALQQVHAWRDAGYAIPVAVNLSMRNLANQELPETIASLLTAWDIPPAWLVVEITESAIMPSPERVLGVLARLSNMGIQIAIDDFGTGYSSLSYLRTMPVDLIKIDKSFVTPMARNPDDYAIVRSTIELGHHFGVPVVAEGVEDQTTLDLLCDLGCDSAQGYFLTRPLPAPELERWLCDSPWRLVNGRSAAHATR
jgi:diguanylate cyclase (GGDEF)-like protein